jgi:arylsulfatase A-like enzyme
MARRKRTAAAAERAAAAGSASWRRASLLAFAVLLAAFGLAAQRFLKRAPAADPRLSILLITIDTLRADALGAYGRPSAGTPVIDRLARAGVRFSRAHAHNVVTLPSHANILTGRLPYQHGIRDNSGFRLPPGSETLATLLKTRGFATGAFVSAFPVDSRFGLAQGFDVYDDRLGDPEAGPAFQRNERSGAETVAAALDWLRSRGDQPYFCWVHLFEPHAPYASSPQSAALSSRDAYQRDVAAADAALQPLLAPLLDAGRAARAMVVLTADHGEALGDHGERTHGILTYEPTLHVPLILFHPRLEPRVVDSLVQHVDILPTILAAVGARRPESAAGRSLLPLAAGALKPPVPVYFESLTPALTRGWAPARGFIDGRWKYIHLPVAELYDIADDPGETRNVLAKHSAEGAKLRAAIDALPGTLAAAPIREDAAVRERLAALGYTSTRGALDKTWSVEDDPKKLVELEEALDEVMALRHAGRLAQARSRCEALVERSPKNPVFLRQLAWLAHEAGDLNAALDAAQRAFAADSDSAENASLLGRCLNEAGRAKETAALLGPLAELAVPDLDVMMTLAAALAQTGQYAEARAVLGRARTIDATSGLLWLNLATVELMEGKLDRAQANLETALAHEPRLARAYTSLGAIAARRGDDERAALMWRRAVELHPGEYDALFNLGALLARSGRAAEARPYLEAFARRAPSAAYARDLPRAQRLLRDRVMRSP